MSEFRKVKPEAVVVTKNVRRHFDGQKMLEMTESVRQHGVVEPIIVRPWKKDKLGEWELIAGERRLRAARAAGLDEIPVVVKDVDDRGMAELQLLENLHREDLEPLEEARALQALLAQGGHTVEALADRVHRSATYVYRAVRLLELPPSGLEALEAGKLTPAHAHQILRVPEAEREGVVQHALQQLEVVRAYPASDLRDYIDHQCSSELSQAIFPKGKPYAGEVACGACPHNSGNQGQLFDGAEKGRCNFQACFERKTAAFLEEYSQKVAGDFPGVQYLGIRKMDYMGGVDGLKRAVIVPEAPKKLLKAHPDKFGWCVLAPRLGHKLTAVVVCLDRKVLEPPTERGAAVRGAGAKRSERDQFVAAREDAAVRQAVRDTVEPRSRFDFTPVQWAAILDHVNHDDGSGDDGLVRVEGKADRHLAQALLEAAVFQAPNPDLAIEAMDINVEKVRAAAAKDAEREWAKTHPEK